LQNTKEIDASAKAQRATQAHFTGQDNGPLHTAYRETATVSQEGDDAEMLISGNVLPVDAGLLKPTTPSNTLLASVESIGQQLNIG
jgi:hypothetical protein